MTTEIRHTGVITHWHADAQAERLKEIMKEHGINFGDAINIYIATNMHIVDHMRPSPLTEAEPVPKASDVAHWPDNLGQPRRVPGVHG